MNTDKFRYDLGLYLKQGTTQTELSKMSGIRQNAISRFVNGKCKTASMDFFLALSPFVYGSTPATPTSSPEAAEADNG